MSSAGAQRANSMAMQATKSGGLAKWCGMAAHRSRMRVRAGVRQEMIPSAMRGMLCRVLIGAELENEPVTFPQSKGHHSLLTFTI